MVTSAFEVSRCARNIVTVAVGKGREVAKSGISVAIEVEAEQPYPVLLLIPLWWWVPRYDRNTVAVTFAVAVGREVAK